MDAFDFTEDEEEEKVEKKEETQAKA